MFVRGYHFLQLLPLNHLLLLLQNSGLLGLPLATSLCKRLIRMLRHIYSLLELLLPLALIVVNLGLGGLLPVVVFVSYLFEPFVRDIVFWIPHNGFVGLEVFTHSRINWSFALDVSVGSSLHLHQAAQFIWESDIFVHLRPTTSHFGTRRLGQGLPTGQLLG